MEKKKVVLRLDAHDEKAWQKAMKTVTRLPGIESLTKDPKDSKLTVIGDADPVVVVCKLRKLFCTEVVTIGPAKEPEKKKEEPKKEEPKKPDKPIEVKPCRCHPYPCQCHPYSPCFNPYPVYCAVENPNPWWFF
ncbi:heavy metal-associated isoprenylated plant protein 12 isoform X2 [Diospyros lotus]|uniref:heavy metal-associated isoprenylated plant protein 12 isoform X2 n=1 Tax=Diospyros lotus TaxID=55363 RepID=UPI002256B56D|nr:heavy metal-associated isoprenylated plant protein 12 isoform X2 [Diospyros lotus]